MPSLLSFSVLRFPNIAGELVEEVSKINLYYLVEGRNAWNSKWIRQYADGCMHTDEQSARESAEKQRTQGSVFEISQIPAVLFRSASGFLAVTQINTDRPLATYSPDAVDSPNQLSDWALDCYVTKGVPMLGVVHTFQYGSRFWKQQPPPKNSVVLVATENKYSVFSSKMECDDPKMRSSSIGKAYRLSWIKMSDKPYIKAGHAISIAARFFS